MASSRHGVRRLPCDPPIVWSLDGVVALLRRRVVASPCSSVAKPPYNGATLCVCQELRAVKLTTAQVHTATQQFAAQIRRSAISEGAQPHPAFLFGSATEKRARFADLGHKPSDLVRIGRSQPPRHGDAVRRANSAVVIASSRCSSIVRSRYPSSRYCVVALSRCRFITL